MNAQHNSLPSFSHRVRIPKSAGTEQFEMEDIAIGLRCFGDFHPLGGESADVVAGSNADSGSIDKTMYFEIYADFNGGSFLDPLFF